MVFPILQLLCLLWIMLTIIRTDRWLSEAFAIILTEVFLDWNFKMHLQPRAVIMNLYHGRSNTTLLVLRFFYFFPLIIIQIKINKCSKRLYYCFTGNLFIPDFCKHQCIYLAKLWMFKSDVVFQGAPGPQGERGEKGPQVKLEICMPWIYCLVCTLHPLISNLKPQYNHFVTFFRISNIVKKISKVPALYSVQSKLL